MSEAGALTAGLWQAAQSESSALLCSGHSWGFRGGTSEGVHLGSRPPGLYRSKVSHMRNAEVRRGHCSLVEEPRSRAIRTRVRESAIDADVLPKLTVEDLKDLGITAVGHRRKLLDVIAALRAPAAKIDI